MSSEENQVELARGPQQAMFAFLGLNFLLLRMDRGWGGGSVIVKMLYRQEEVSQSPERAHYK